MGHCSAYPNDSSYGLTAGFLRRATAAAAGIVALMASVRTGKSDKPLVTAAVQVTAARHNIERSA